MDAESIIDFLSPISIQKVEADGSAYLSGHVSAHTGQSGIPALTPGGVCLMGVCESRGNEGNVSAADSPDLIREWFYKLRTPEGAAPLVDLGNIKAGESLTDTHFALRRTMAFLLKAKQTVIVIGGSQDLTHACYMAYGDLEQVVNVAVIDPSFDLGDAESELNSSTYLSNMVLEQPNHLFNLSHLGYQSYFVSPSEVDLMKKLYFEAVRLGDLQADLEQVEPMVRNADMVSFDLAAIRYSDNPANHRISSNGLYGEEACKMCRYSGMSDKLTTLGLFDLTPSLDNNGQSAHLVAQMMWYFLQGHASRCGDIPVKEETAMTRYTVVMQNGEYPTVFYKSHASDRWWMEVPYPTKKDSRYNRHVLVPCAYQDYEMACNDEIPDRWWQTYQKLI